MDWNIAPEFVSLLIIFILMIYAQEYNLLPTRKNKLFRFCLGYVFLEIIISILSIWAIQFYQVIPVFLNHVIQALYFLASPMIAVLFFFYIIAVIRENVPKIGASFRIALIPYAIYSVFVFLNPLTGMLYYFTETEGFIFGPWFVLVYLVPALYMLMMMIFIWVHRTRLERSMILILVSFPMISLLMLVIQWLFPAVILSGSGAAAALLILYLYLQNKQIVIDDLTGLQNRKAFANILALNVDHYREMDIFLVSLDDFRLINKRFGQPNGDHFIRSVSRFLTGIVPRKTVFRYSGDEFIILLDPSVSVSAADLNTTIRDRFGKIWQEGAFHTMLSVSIAVVQCPEHTSTVQGIITLMEYCIDRSKKNGKGKTIFSEAALVAQLKRKDRIVEGLKIALIRDTFRVFYQPLFCRQEHRFTMAEALLRFTDPELGIISPGEFIPIAEEAGLIDQIGLMVLEKTCQFIKVLNQQKVPFQSVSINISALHMNSETIVADCLEIIQKNGISPDQLRFEITESVLVGKGDHVRKVLREFNEEGIRFYMDDFGTGYANIANIIDLPFECIKFDKSILYKSIADGRGHSILKCLGRTFMEIGMKVVVEGVEDMEQNRLVEDIDADYIQGFLYARPMPADKAMAYLAMPSFDVNAVRLDESR